MLYQFDCDMQVNMAFFSYSFVFVPIYARTSSNLSREKTDPALVPF